MASFYIENFGCRAARADGEAIASRLIERGIAERCGGQADVVVINTCSVTAEADRDARAFIRKTTRSNPNAKIMVTGCYAQRDPEAIAALPGVYAVVGNSHKALIPGIIDGLLRERLRTTEEHQDRPSTLIQVNEILTSAPNLSEIGKQLIWVDDSFAHSSIEVAQIVPGVQTRPNLKIQEGCGNRCTFCVIPTTRGSSRSMTPEKVLEQVNGFVAAGGNELVVSGINLGRWGRDLGGDLRLAGLIRTVLQTTGLPRLRLSSIEPMDWTEEMISLIREFGGSRFARHVHLPLQSGSDSVLRRMHRRYRPWHYAEKVVQLVGAVGPELAIGADVMVGFPGENEAEFLKSYDFVASLPFTYLHLFPFSARPGTPGWELHRLAPVPGEAVKERLSALKALADRKAHQFRINMIGRTLPAVTLNPSLDQAARAQTSCMTDNYLSVELPNSVVPNRLVDARITGLLTSGVLEGCVEAPEPDFGSVGCSSIEIPSLGD